MTSVLNKGQLYKFFQGNKNMAEQYKRGQYNTVAQFIIKSLQSLGGSASREAIKKEIASDNANPFSDEQIYGIVISKNGKPYSPFIYEFNFSIKNLLTCGYIEEYRRKGDIVLTEKGRVSDYSLFPNAEEEEKIRQYWDKKKEERIKRKDDNIINQYEDKNTEDEIENNIIEKDSNNEQWKFELLERIKSFSPAKFESFSRLLFSKMGIKFDPEKGVKMSNDHGIDGYGYFVSDEFKTSIVVVQCKRFTDNSVSEPDIDKFKGVISKHNADYGIFVTTSYFTEPAKKAALQGNNKVTLIDGNKLVELIEKYQLYIQPIQIY